MCSSVPAAMQKLESSLSGLYETLDQLLQDQEDQKAYLNNSLNGQLVEDTNQPSNYNLRTRANNIDYKETRSYKKDH